MNTPLRSLLGLCVVLPLAAGCASRTAPFDQMDQAQITVLRLQGVEPPPVAVAPAAATNPLIPGLPAELQQMGQTALQGLQQALPPGLLPPGLIPGMPAATPVAPVAQQQPRFLGFVILAQMQLTDATVKDELLDLFGNEDSFQAGQSSCLIPGMGVAMQRPNAQPVELLISLSCNQAVGNGFQWPYKVNSFTPETSQRFTKVYEKLWGPVPAGGA